jgi:2-polyprenyl-3-methyl-5-hydroxy-6-metoxy-1,4-benzoquinol methylase
MDDLVERSQPEVWDSVWRETQLTALAVRRKFDRELNTLRWKAIRGSFREHFGCLKGLRTIELGAGTGDISMLLASEGAVPTLLDANERALTIARLQFEVLGYGANFITDDFFHLDSTLLGQFDAAVSYGVVEHFRGNDRVLACKSHVDVLRPGAMVAISVPNAHCLPYRLNKWKEEKLGKWVWGLEIPYTRKELGEVAREIGLKSWSIHGSSFLRDWDQFLLSPITSRICKYTGFSFEKWTPFDRIWGHAQTLIGSI